MDISERHTERHTNECAVHSPILRPCSCGLETRLRDLLTAANARIAELEAVVELYGRLIDDLIQGLNNIAGNRTFMLDLLRSAKEIAKREGHETNWEAWNAKLDKFFAAVLAAEGTDALGRQIEMREASGDE